MIKGDIGWFLTLLTIISASGPMLSVLLDYRNRKRTSEADAENKDADTGLKKVSEQELSQKVVSMNEERWVTREKRWEQREEQMEQEISGLREAVQAIRADFNLCLEFIANDEQWHFYDRMHRIQNGIPPAQERVTFQEFMETRKEKVM